MVKKMISPFYLDFKKNPYSYILIPIAIVQLLTYLATANDNFIPAIMFAIILVLVGKYTNDATYKLGIPIVVTFVLIRYDILKQNFWEGIENKDDDDVTEPQNTNHDKDSNEEDKKVKVQGKEVQGKDVQGKEVQGKDVEEDKEVEVDKEVDVQDKEEEEGDGRSGFTNNDNALNNTMDKIDNTLDRLERSYDRIMKVGSKLGMSKEMNSLSKSLDITGILNQKKKLA